LLAPNLTSKLSWLRHQRALQIPSNNLAGAHPLRGFTPLNSGVGQQQRDSLKRYLITALFFFTAGGAYVSGNGPLFFGAPLLGSLFVAAGVLLEITAWWRVTHHAQRLAGPRSEEDVS
jgi:hypothetical protein